MENENQFEVFGDRDETQGILLRKTYTLQGALVAAAELVEFWDRIIVWQNDSRIAVISLKALV